MRDRILLALCALVGMTAGAHAQAIPLAPDPKPNPDGWYEARNISKLNGRESYHALKLSNETMTNGIGSRARASLSLSCRGDRLMIGLDWPSYMGLDSVDIQTSIDRSPIRNWSFDLTPTNLAFLYGHKNWAKFSQSALNGQTLVVRVNAYADAQEASFDLRGVNEVMGAASSLCAGK